MATAVPSRLQTDFKSTVQVMGNIPPDTSKNPVMNSLETSCRILVAFIFFFSLGVRLSFPSVTESAFLRAVCLPGGEPNVSAVKGEGRVQSRAARVGKQFCNKTDYPSAFKGEVVPNLEIREMPPSPGFPSPLRTRCDCMHSARTGTWCPSAPV